MGLEEGEFRGDDRARWLGSIYFEFSVVPPRRWRRGLQTRDLRKVTKQHFALVLINYGFTGRDRPCVVGIGKMTV